MAAISASRFRFQGVVVAALLPSPPRFRYPSVDAVMMRA
jgi:hypothetical protein